MTIACRRTGTHENKLEKHLIFWKDGCHAPTNSARVRAQTSRDVVPTRKINREGTTTLPRTERNDTETVPHRQSPDATEPISTGTLFHVTRGHRNTHSSTPLHRRIGAYFQSQCTDLRVKNLGTPGMFQMFFETRCVRPNVFEEMCVTKCWTK